MTHWSSRLLAARLGISFATVSRIWRKWKTQPHRIEIFKFSTDLSYLDHGAWLTLDLDVRAAASLRRDGTLLARPEWRF